jgi:hypothetical protein
MVKASTMAKGVESYPVIELFDDLKAGIFIEIRTGAAIDVYRRQLQQAYVERMDALVNPKAITPTGDLAALVSLIATQGDPDGVDVTAAARYHLKGLQSDVRKAGGMTADRITRIHLEDLDRRISKALNPEGR